MKVLDFGLAKALDPVGGSAHLSESPTITAHATRGRRDHRHRGVYVARASTGRSVDRRADIWSFGCVLFELITGRRPFDGDSTTEMLAHVIEREPNWDWLPANTPLDVRHLLARCLTKDPNSSPRDIGDARIAIDDVLDEKLNAPKPEPTRPTAPPATLWVHALPWGLSAVLAMAAAYPLVGRPAVPTREGVTL